MLTRPFTRYTKQKGKRTRKQDVEDYRTNFVISSSQNIRSNCGVICCTQVAIASQLSKMYFAPKSLETKIAGGKDSKNNRCQAYKSLYSVSLGPSLAHSTLLADRQATLRSMAQNKIQPPWFPLIRALQRRSANLIESVGILPCT